MEKPKAKRTKIYNLYDVLSYLNEIKPGLKKRILDLDWFLCGRINKIDFFDVLEDREDFDLSKEVFEDMELFCNEFKDHNKILWHC